MLNFSHGEPFSTGRARYLDHDADLADVKVFVRIEPQGLDAPILAQLDTGAGWSVFDVEIAEALGLLNGDGEQISISTRLGNFNGRLEESTIRILAEDGDSLDVDARVFISQEWPGRTFLGYRGLLERIRIALDPQGNDFYFGNY